MKKNIVACPVHSDNETTPDCPDCRPNMTPNLGKRKPMQPLSKKQILKAVKLANEDQKRLYESMQPTPKLGKWEGNFKSAKREFDFMVKPEHSERLWYVVESLIDDAQQQGYAEATKSTTCACVCSKCLDCGMNSKNLSRKTQGGE